ncbi:sialidase family protein [Streptomyces sp. NPDC041003]|uniref:sialidase family protein n=1 Tax=Streptomyces sp. NPDC041003 TaxID=3155730 RepID=UPI0033F8E475
MRVLLPLTAVTTAALLLVTVTGATPAAADRNRDGTPLVKVSEGDPYAKCTIGARSPDSIVYPATEVEPYLSVDPRHPERVVTVFQQDRWNDGGARGLVASWTTDGHTFHRSTLPFSLCAPGGADYERATDPWVSTGPDGTVYASGEGVDFTKSTRTALLAATSRDGGRTWQNLTTTHVDEQPFFNDKPSLTADPIREGTAYQVWNRLDNDPPGPSSLDGPGYISVTRDGGRTWSEAQPFVDTSTVPNTQTIGHQIVVDRNTGTLYDFFDRITYSEDLSTVVEARYEVVTSTDVGARGRPAFLQRGPPVMSSTTRPGSALCCSSIGFMTAATAVGAGRFAGEPRSTRTREWNLRAPPGRTLALSGRGPLSRPRWPGPHPVLPNVPRRRSHRCGGPREAATCCLFARHPFARGQVLMVRAGKRLGACPPS